MDDDERTLDEMLGDDSAGREDDAVESGAHPLAFLLDGGARLFADDVVAEPPAGSMFRVTCDGTVNGTRVYADDGSEVTKHVRSVTVEHVAGELPRVSIVMTAALVDFTGLLDTYRVRDLVDRAEQDS